ncbi:MAG: DUF488 domain-containing protein [Desulfobacterota bacterium]|nr:DUF488 domain-containing protein [Thermodesulfobacteriota bacterium]
MPKAPRVIYSLGTSRRSLREFVDLLREHAIEVGVDVRSFPQSRFPHFSRPVLSRELASEGIGYLYLGEELGGFRKEGYLRHMASEAFRRGMGRLERIGQKRRTAFFCAERFPWRCHRRWISEELIRRGWRVLHILGPGEIWEPGPEEVDILPGLF